LYYYLSGAHEKARLSNNYYASLASREIPDSPASKQVLFFLLWLIRVHSVDNPIRSKKIFVELFLGTLTLNQMKANSLYGTFHPSVEAISQGLEL